MRLFISMIIVVLLVCPVSVHAAYGDWCWTQECHDDAEEDKQQTLEFLLGVVVVVSIYAIIASASSTDIYETELTTKWISQFSKNKPQKWIGSNGELIVLRW